LLAILIVIGISAYQSIHLRGNLIAQTRRINHDLYRAIIFPYRKNYEKDVLGISAVLLYGRFKKAILSNEYPELGELRVKRRIVSVISIVFIIAVLAFVLWLGYCRAVSIF
jgi:hypothetical protein